MSHYRTGTAAYTNNSAIVIGTGTDWISGAAPGECIKTPDGKLVEILSIQAATQLTMGENYLGATAAGQAYSIVPTQSFMRDVASQAATLVNEFGATKLEAIRKDAADKATIVDADKLGGRDSVTGIARLFSLSTLKTALASWLNAGTLPLSVTSITATGLIYKGNTPATNSCGFQSAGSTTGAVYTNLGNTGNALYSGVETSVGNTFLIGSLPYDAFVTDTNGVGISFGVGQTKVARLSSVGLTVTGFGSFTESINLTGQNKFASITNLATGSEAAPVYSGVDFKNYIGGIRAKIESRDESQSHSRGGVVISTTDAGGTMARRVLIDNFGQVVTGYGYFTGEVNTPNAQSDLFFNKSGSGSSGAVLSTTENQLWAAGAKVINISLGLVAVTGVVTPEADNTRTLGTGALRWSTVYAGTGTINTSDAREKTPVRSLTTDEISASKGLAAEIGAYQFLSAVAEKGASAREHIGMTVQRVIEIMQTYSLDPFGYGFVCYDAWEDMFVQHPAIEAVAAVSAVPAVMDGDQIVTPALDAVAAVEAKAAWSEQTQTAGDRYAFRMDELLMFIARGFEARLSALETA